MRTPSHRRTHVARRRYWCKLISLPFTVVIFVIGYMLAGAHYHFRDDDGLLDKTMFSIESWKSELCLNAQAHVAQTRNLLLPLVMCRFVIAGHARATDARTAPFLRPRRRAPTRHHVSHSSRDRRDRI